MFANNITQCLFRSQEAIVFDHLTAFPMYSYAADHDQALMEFLDQLDFQIQESL